MTDQQKIEQKQDAIITPEVIEPKKPKTKAELDSLKTEIESDRVTQETASQILSSNLEESNISKELKEEISKMSPEDLEKLRKKLAETDYDEIRTNIRLLNPEAKDEKDEDIMKATKKEVKDRIAAYTTLDAEGYFVLDYKKIKESDETNIGLGDLTRMDPSITKLEVCRKGESCFEANSGVVNGRPCFVDANGKYVATFSGDKFKILSNAIEDKETYIKAIEDNKKLYSDYKINFYSHEYIDNSINYSQFDAVYADPLLKQTNSELNSDLVTKAQEASKSATRINNFEDLESQNPALAQLIRHVSKYFNVPEPLIYSTFKTESNFRHGAIGDTDLAQSSNGIGQFQPGTWDDISSRPEFKSFIGTILPGVKINRGENILGDITATVVKLKKDAGGKNINLTKPLSSRDILYLRGKYTGFHGGYDKFMKNVDYYLQTGIDNIYEGKDTRYSDYLKTVRKFEYQYTGQAIPQNPYQADLKEDQKNSPSSRTKIGTSEYPYRYFKCTDLLSNGGCIGYERGVSSGFNEKLAASQLQSLSSKGFKKIISLEKGKLIKSVAEKYKIPINVIPSHFDTDEEITENNLNLIKKCNSGEKTYEHCQNGAHRAIVLATMSIIENGTRDLQEAFNKAGGELYRFTDKSYAPILKQLLKFAERKNSTNLEFLRNKIKELER